MKRTGLGFLSSLAVAVPLALGVLGLHPSTASACTIIDPQDSAPPPKLDTCVDQQTYFCPTASGEQQTGYDINNIPAGSVSINQTQTFSGGGSGCPNATLTQTFDPNATTENPDHSLPNPPPGEQAARVVWTFTGTGSSAGGSGTETFTTGFEEPVQNLVIQMQALDLSGQPLSAVVSPAAVTFRVSVTNPNDDPVTGNIGVNISSRDHTVAAKFGAGVQSYDGMSCERATDGFLGDYCSFNLPAGGTGLALDARTLTALAPTGSIQGAAAPFDSPKPHQTVDGQPVGGNTSDVFISVAASPTCTPAAKTALTLLPACAAATAPKKCKAKGKKSSEALIAKKKKCKRKH